MEEKSIPGERKKINFFAHKRNGTLLTAKQVEVLFGVTPATIFNWRNRAQLPVYHLHSPGLKKPPVRYDLGELLHWAELNKIKVVKPFDEKAKSGALKTVD